MPARGVEPLRSFEHVVLSHACMPIPARGHLPGRSAPPTLSASADFTSYLIDIKVFNSFATRPNNIIPIKLNLINKKDRGALAQNPPAGGLHSVRGFGSLSPFCVGSLKYEGLQPGVEFLTFGCRPFG